MFLSDALAWLHRALVASPAAEHRADRHRVGDAEGGACDTRSSAAFSSPCSAEAGSRSAARPARSSSSLPASSRSSASTGCCWRLCSRGSILVVGGAGPGRALHRPGAGAGDRRLHGRHRADHRRQPAQGSARPFRAHVPADLVNGLAGALGRARRSLNLAALAVGLSLDRRNCAAPPALPWFPGPCWSSLAASAAVALLRLPVDTIYSRFGALPAGLPPPPSAREHRADQRAPAVRFRDRLPRGGEFAALGDRRRPDDRGEPSFRRRTPRSRRREHRLALVRRAAATGAIARTATNVRAGGRTPVAGIVHALTILLISLGAASLAGYLAMPALAGAADRDRLADERAVAMGRAHEPAPRRSSPVLHDHGSDRLSNLTIAIAVGTGAGLGLRLMRRDVEPRSGIRRIARSSRGYLWRPTAPSPGDAFTRGSTSARLKSRLPRRQNPEPIRSSLVRLPAPLAL